MDRDEMVSRLDFMSQYFAARGDMAVGDGKLLLIACAKAACEAAALVKAQTPRVIGISKIYTAKKLDVWIEDKGENTVHPLMLIETEMTDKSQTVFFYPILVRPIKAYGETWRCWTARPTDEQRKAVAWDG